jgi:hypothetical protein
VSAISDVAPQLDPCDQHARCRRCARDGHARLRDGRVERTPGRHSGIEVSRRWVYLFRIRRDRIAAQIGVDDKDEAIRMAENAAHG